MDPKQEITETEFIAVHWQNKWKHTVSEVHTLDELLKALNRAVDESYPNSSVAIEVGLGKDGEVHPLNTTAKSLSALLNGLGIRK